MRCQKCGYISFDYLSECKSCGVDLKAVRDGLGLFSFEPAIPFFLERLLKGQEDVSFNSGDAGEAAKEPLDDTLPTIEFSETFELDTVELYPDSEGSPALSAPPPAQEEMKEHLDSALKVFEEIESLEGSPAAASKPSEPEPMDDLEIDFVLDEDFSLDEAPKAAKAPESAQAQLSMEIPELSLEEPQIEDLTLLDETASKKPVIEVSDQDIDQIVLDPDLDGELDLELEFDEPSIEQPLNAKEPKTDLKAAESGEDSLVLELSEDDVESLILELEDDESDKK